MLASVSRRITKNIVLTKRASVAPKTRKYATAEAVVPSLKVRVSVCEAISPFLAFFWCIWLTLGYYLMRLVYRSPFMRVLSARKSKKSWISGRKISNWKERWLRCWRGSNWSTLLELRSGRSTPPFMYVLDTSRCDQWAIESNLWFPPFLGRFLCSIARRCWFINDNGEKQY